jgi:hypothetical protein
LNTECESNKIIGGGRKGRGYNKNDPRKFEENKETKLPR